MYTEYFFYLNTLTEAEKNKQTIILLIFWIAMFAVAGILELVKYKYKGKTQNKKFQKFLEKI